MQHKIRIENDENQAKQISGDYVKGYDRLTNGFALMQYVGYQYLSNRRLVNFNLGVELYEGFTQNRRSYNFDEMRKDDTKRKDYLFGIRFGWVIPLYKKVPNLYYVN